MEMPAFLADVLHITVNLLSTLAGRAGELLFAAVAKAIAVAIPSVVPPVLQAISQRLTEQLGNISY